MTNHDEQLDLFDPNPGAVKAFQANLEGSPLFCSHPLPQGLFLGTSSWSFPGWSGLVYDREYSDQRLAERGLEAYASHRLFGCVSLDKTYYRPASEREYARLAAQVPAAFRFVVKAPRDLLRRCDRGFDAGSLERGFLQPAARGLGAKLGPILLQFPPGAWREWGSPTAFLGDLGSLLGKLPKELSYSVEVRDEELLGTALSEALGSNGVALCASIHSSLPSMEKQLLSVPPAPGAPLVFRWNLRPSLGYEEAREDFRPFNALRSPDLRRRTTLVQMIARALDAGRQLFVTVNNKAEGCAPLSLVSLLTELEQARRKKP